MITPAVLIFASWAVFLLVWLALSFFVKRDLPGGLSARTYQVRTAVVVIIVFIAIRTARQHGSGDTSLVYRLSLFEPSLALAWIAAAFTAIGIAVAIWARLYIGRNWSSRPAMKEGHELVTGGPYAFVRHPIYSGIILAALGTALTGSVVGVVLVVVLTGIFLARVGKEERFMLELFPGAYPSYQARTRRLVPFIW